MKGVKGSVPALQPGQIFGSLMLKRPLDPEQVAKYWWTKCGCGNVTKKSASHLRGGQVFTCGIPLCSERKKYVALPVVHRSKLNEHGKEEEMIEPLGVECRPENGGCGAIVGESCKGKRKTYLATFHTVRVFLAREFARKRAESAE